MGRSHRGGNLHDQALSEAALRHQVYGLSTARASHPQVSILTTATRVNPAGTSVWIARANKLNPFPGLTPRCG